MESGTPLSAMTTTGAMTTSTRTTSTMTRIPPISSVVLPSLQGQGTGQPPSSHLPTEWAPHHHHHHHHYHYDSLLVKLRGGGSAPSIVEEILKCDPDDYYAILGLESSPTTTQTQTQITKAYRKRAVQTHPDKTNGDRSAFDLVAKAYEVLGDESKKAIYDRYGVAGLNAASGGGTTPGGGASSFQDFFSTMFQQQQQQQRRPSKNQTRRYQLQVSLEDLYTGVTQQVFIQEPGTMSRNRQQQGKQVEVRIPKGTISGQPLRLDGAMDFDTTQKPGDLIFLVVEAPHPTFTRKNHDLAMELTISLQDALCGFENMEIPFLDGSRLHIASAKQQPLGVSTTPMVISTGDVQVLKGKGFPKSPQADPKDPHAHGDLYIQFRVAPIQPSKTATWTLEDRQKLRDLLDKLQGTHKPVTSKTSSTQSTSKTKSSKKSKKSGKGKMTKNPKVTDDDAYDLNPSIDDSNKDTGVTIHSLVPGKVSNFGRATGTAKIQRDEHDDDDNEFFEGRGGFPFGNGASTFFQSSNDGRARSFYFGSSSSPFGGASGLDDDEAQSQCQQM